MYGLAQIYIGCKCGETWDVVPYDDIDTENDRVERFLYCKVCGGNNLKEKLTPEGVPYMHAVTEEEHLVLSGFYEDHSDDWGDWDDEDEYSEEELDDFYGGGYFDSGTERKANDQLEDELPF